MMREEHDKNSFDAIWFLSVVFTAQGLLSSLLMLRRREATVGVFLDTNTYPGIATSLNNSLCVVSMAYLIAWMSSGLLIADSIILYNGHEAVH